MEENSSADKEMLNWPFIIRTLADLFAALFYVIAVVNSQLSSASAILQFSHCWLPWGGFFCVKEFPLEVGLRLALD